MKNADSIYHNGIVYIADEDQTVTQAIAFAEGKVLLAGSSEDVLLTAGTDTEIYDLEGKMLMPGIIDGHMHPYWGAKKLGSFTLDYQSLTVEQTLDKIRGFLDFDMSPDDENCWLKVSSWLRIGGSDVTAKDLDTLNTKRPIFLFSNDCHFLALNSRALEILGIDKNTPPPSDGNILRDAAGNPSGIIEDAPAMRYYDRITAVSGESAAAMIKVAQQALNEQGVTTVMDARADWEAFESWRELKKSGELTVRMLGAREISADECKQDDFAKKSLDQVLGFIKEFNDSEFLPEPGIAVAHLKLFIDGMPTNNTAYVLEPYNINIGTEENPEWVKGTECGEPYFNQQQLDAIFLEAAKRGIHPHMHVIAEGAIEIVLNAIEKMRAAYPDKDVRPGCAHSDIMLPHQYQRFFKNKVFPVLQYQWSGQDQSLIDFQKGLYGDVRFQGLETHAKFIDAGCCVAYGSDWPIDPLNEWYNFQIGMTRKVPSTDSNNVKLDNDRVLTINEVLQSATLNAAKMLAKEQYIGSLEPGKFADFIVLDRNLLTTPANEIKDTKVLKTVVGGRMVHEL